jgi:hypothetical protein
MTDAESPTVRLERDDAVSVLVDGDPFTAYRPDDDRVRKPILFPLLAPSGEPVTRGYPLEPRPGDREDHPHQAGHWFTHGNVNGLDFWNHSPETPAELEDRMGTIRHRETLAADDAGEDAELAVRCDWCRPDGSVLLEETTRFVFRARAGARIVDRTTTLSAGDEAVAFHDSKEGLFGLRVARSLELPVENELVFTDEAGVETVVRATGDHDVTGTYRSSEGRVDEEAWGTRAEWMSLSGTVGDGDVTLVIFDHPANPGHPTHWMARPYGLFAANPLGRSAFEEGATPREFTVDAGDAATFRYRLLVSEDDPGADRIDDEADRFAERIE